MPPGSKARGAEGPASKVPLPMQALMEVSAVEGPVEVEVGLGAMAEPPEATPAESLGLRAPLPVS